MILEDLTLPVSKRLTAFLDVDSQDRLSHSVPASNAATSVLFLAIPLVFVLLAHAFHWMKLRRFPNAVSRERGVGDRRKLLTKRYLLFLLITDTLLICFCLGTYGLEIWEPKEKQHGSSLLLNTHVHPKTGVPLFSLRDLVTCCDPASNVMDAFSTSASLNGTVAKEWDSALESAWNSGTPRLIVADDLLERTGLNDLVAVRHLHLYLTNHLQYRSIRPNATLRQAYENSAYSAIAPAGFASYVADDLRTCCLCYNKPAPHFGGKEPLLTYALILVVVIVAKAHFSLKQTCVYSFLCFVFYTLATLQTHLLMRRDPYDLLNPNRGDRYLFKPCVTAFYATDVHFETHYFVLFHMLVKLSSTTLLQLALLFASR